jgi:acyl-CoA reductase-like NAD-dependent aldehyde dehydrogenase
MKSAGNDMNIKEYRYFTDNQWRKAADNQVFEVHEPYSGKLFAHVAVRPHVFDSRREYLQAFEMAPKVLAGIVNVNSPTVNDEIHAPMGGVRDSGWGRTGPRSLDDFSDVIWINSHSGQRQYPF